MRTVDGKDVTVAQFEKGNFFGEMSIFENAPRSATCSVRRGGRIHYLTNANFKTMQHGYPAISIKILARILDTISQRLDATGEFLADMVHWGEGARKRAITDDFTELFNRRFLDESLNNLLFQARADSQPLTIIMSDLDHFSKINEEYGHSVGDEVILSVVPIFRQHFRDSDILARYGGDEFTFVLPNTTAREAHEISKRIINDIFQLPTLQDRGGTITRIGTSQGIASFPEHASDLKTLLEMADKALYAAKERGRNQAVVAKMNMIKIVRLGQIRFKTERMFSSKVPMSSLAARTRVINNIIDALVEHKRFLVIGHINPDEDCLGAMTSIALLIRKLGKHAAICTSCEMIGERLFIPEIWDFNDILLINPKTSNMKPVTNYDVVIICDTPKPDMLDLCNAVRELLSSDDVLKIEIDHHISADSSYMGNDGYCLVNATSSSCMLVAHLLFKLHKNRTLLEQYHVDTIYPRNVVLMALTGIIGDTMMGKFIQSQQEKRMYDLVVRQMNYLLAEQTRKEGFLASVDDIHRQFLGFFPQTQGIYRYAYARADITGTVGYLLLDETESNYIGRQHDADTMIVTMRKLADRLAEESGYVSLVGYFDARSGLLQFRARRNSNYKHLDLRHFLKEFKVKSGGGTRRSSRLSLSARGDRRLQYLRCPAMQNIG